MRMISAHKLFRQDLHQFPTEQDQAGHKINTFALVFENTDYVGLRRRAGRAEKGGFRACRRNQLFGQLDRCHAASPAAQG